MQHLDTRVIHQGIQWLEKQPVWLCTVLNTYGSAPRVPGALMVATKTGQYSGSLSGGCIEEDLLQRITAGEYLAGSQVIRYGEGGLSPTLTLPCGGVLDILIEYLPAGQQSMDYLTRIGQALNGHKGLIKRLCLPNPCKQLEVATGLTANHVNYQQQHITLCIAASPRLLIAGLSDVALYCADFAVALGFEVLVCEHRPQEITRFASKLKTEVTLHNRFPARYLEEEGCHANTAIVALTHDPRIDDLTLMEAIYTPAYYIGVMGSQRNSQRRRERLQKTAEFTPHQLSRIHAPIGLAIDSKTPAEIALSVMADIVKHKNTPRG